MGRHILAHHDGETVIVYQAYRSSIGRHAVAHGALGGDFSYGRMSWIKPNFLWMMYRSGWGTKPDQEMTLALRLRRTFFDAVLAQAVASSFDAADGVSHDQWQAALASSAVRLQWDPDHDPGGRLLARRAIQLGLRGAALEDFGRRELLEVIDLSEFVATRRRQLESAGWASLSTPVEHVYVPEDPALAKRLRLD